MEKNKDKIEAVAILGPPSSGKTLICKMLSQTGDFYHFSIGEMFRSLNPESELRSTFNKYASRGFLMPDKVVTDQFKLHINALIKTQRFCPQSQKLILDGFPKTLGQAENLSQILEIYCVIILKINELDFNLFQKNGRDLNNVLRKKVQIFNNETLKSTSFYDERIVYFINANQKPLFIIKDILNNINL